MPLDAGMLQAFSEDRALASQVIFAHRHPQESPVAHVEMMDMWGSSNPFVVIEAAREFGKTTLAEEFLILAGAFGNFNYWLLLGETYLKACERLASLDIECRTNEALLEVFGGKVLKRKSTENKMWFGSGAHIQALGWDQELQSFKFGAHRPDGAYLDDVENEERVRDKAAVDASWSKLYFELLPALDKMRRRIRLVQTRRAEDCMITRAKDNQDWLYRGYPVCNGDPDDPKTVSNWPARYPMEWIRAEKRTFERAGKLDKFLQAYMLQTIDESAKPFRVDQLSELDLSPHHWMARHVVYDPARTTNRERTKVQSKSDQYGKVVLSRLGSRILVHESGGFHWTPDEFIADLFDTDERHHPAEIAIEKNSLDDWLMHPVRTEIIRRGHPLPVKGLNAPQDKSKDLFIMGLQPFVIAGDIVLVGGKAMHPQLVQQIANFPHGSRDVLNALAYAAIVFSGIPMYEDFSGANIGDAPAPRLGEAVYVGFNANPSEVVAVCVLRDGRRLRVAKDFSTAGAITDAVKSICFDVRASFRGAKIEAWLPADLYDQWQRVALLPALRAEKLSPYRAENIAVARGCLSERIRTTWHNARLLTVDREAILTLNALSDGYALAVEKGGRAAHAPKEGISRLVAEALETMVAMIDQVGEQEGMPEGANVAHNAAGAAYMTANPRRRA